jgi:putative oxidoreductase
MKKLFLETAPRILLGIIFLLGAIDGFWFVFSGAHLIHPPTSDRGLAFEQALKAVGFFWPFMKLVELTGALCLLTNRAPALGLALLAPIMAVVVLFHAVLNPQGIPMAALLIVCGVLLARAYARRYASLFERGAAEPRFAAGATQVPPR